MSVLFGASRRYQRCFHSIQRCSPETGISGTKSRRNWRHNSDAYNYRHIKHNHMHRWHIKHNHIHKNPEGHINIKHNNPEGQPRWAIHPKGHPMWDIIHKHPEGPSRRAIHPEGHPVWNKQGEMGIWIPCLHTLWLLMNNGSRWIELATKEAEYYSLCDTQNIK
jgi:hypothetical protein